MAINNESLVKFGYSVGKDASTTAGFITFDSSRQAIYVGDGAAANLVTSSVKDATYADNILTITKIDGTTHTLNFKDVASASGTMAAFNELKIKLGEVDTTLGNLGDAIDGLDASYKAADASLDKRIGVLEGLVGEGGDVDERINDAIETLDSSLKSYADGLDASIRADFAAEDASIRSEFAAADTALDASLKSYVDTKVSNLGGSETGEDASKFVTVTVNTTAGQVSGVTVVGKDIASATDLNDVSTRLDAFLNGEGVADTVDTLKDIQAWINGDGVNATELTQAIATEADLRTKADASIRADFAAADTALDASLKSYVDGKVDGKFDASGAAATAESNAKAHSDANLATAKTYAENQASAAQSAAISAAAGDATSKANAAESAAKGYADTQIAAIKVNGVTIKDASLDGTHIKVGGQGTHTNSAINVAIEDLYTEVGKAANAGVQSLAVDSSSADYAEVDKTTGAVSLKIKTTKIANASSSNTGVADAWDVKESIRVAKETVEGNEGDASTAATVAGAKTYAKEYADAQIEANALRWVVLS